MKSHEPTTSYKVNHFTSHWFDTKRYGKIEQKGMGKLNKKVWENWTKRYKTVYLRTTKKNYNTMKHCERYNQNKNHGYIQNHVFKYV